MNTGASTLRRAVITGGSSGIGLAAAQLMLERGYRVVSLDMNPPSEDTVEFFQADVGDETSIGGAIQEAVEALGGIDVVVNSAGISSVGPVDANSDDEWMRALNVNVVGIARVCRHALPHLRSGHMPAIVNLASVASHTGIPNRVVYSATKGAVLAMTLAMATDYLNDGIRVNAVAPGTVDTPWVARLLAQADDPAQARQSLEARQPIGRLVTAEEVALAICYLADPQTGSSTGTILDVDGGMHRLAPPR